MKKIGLLALALVLALGTLGVGYAMWTDTVTLTGTVSTGSLILGIRDVASNDNGTVDDSNFDPNDNGADPQCGAGFDNSEGKNVASLVSSNGTLKTGCTGWYASINEVFSHVYPGYGPSTWIQIGNCGTVPVKVYDIAAYYVAPGCANPVDLMPWMTFCWKIYDETGALISDSSGTIYDFATALGHPQIAGGEWIDVYLQTCFAEEYQPPEGGDPMLLPENACASYNVVITGAQWNEVP